MADYCELRARRGRLYYASSLPDDPERGYFRSRQRRAHILRITQPAGNISEFDLPLPPCVNGPSLSKKLAGSKENAKRFLRLVASSNAEQKSGDRSVDRKYKRRSIATAAPPARDEMLDSRRNSQILSGVFSGSSSNRNSVAASSLAPPTQRPQLGEDFRTSSQRSAVSTSSTNSNATTSSTSTQEKPVASGNGLAISIQLAEPMLFLQGYDQHDASSAKTTMLRGTLKLRVSKSAKIKTISLSFRGKATTDWPEGIPPRKTEFKDTESIMNHTWTFFNFRFPNADGHCADEAQVLKGPRTTTTEVGVTDSSLEGLSAKDLKRLSLQANQSRSFGKGESQQTVAGAKGYRIFTPGEYTYNFELPIDSRMPESIAVELGRVKYELEAIVERSGAFRANLIGQREVTLIRAPAENSLETVEPIAISRDWEDQLHYDIVISGKSFPLGSQVPIAFKLTPLAKVQCHRIKVFVTENIQYFTANKKVHRLEPTRRIQLFEKRADSHSTSAYPGSTVRITAGGGVAYDSRAAAASGDESVDRDNSNLLGNLHGEHNVGPTEMEFNVQLPSCHQMAQKDRAARIHFDTTYSNIQVNHWIKIVMRLSKPDVDDPSKRRHFEISIDSPFNILSCRATQANISLPAYTSPESAQLLSDQTTCGCPGAPRRRNSPSELPGLPLPNSVANADSPSASSTSLSSQTPANTNNLPSPPQTAHVHDNIPAVQRPMHLLRAPSFNPPAWSDEDPPPPLVTPPPRYETLVSDPRSGLADYFQRLADEVGEDDDVSVAARMEIPLTPGGRVNRSMDEIRTWLPVGQDRGVNAGGQVNTGINTDTTLVTNT